MPPLIDTPQALDAAIVASRHTRREKVVRAARNQRIRTRVAFGLAGCIAILALVAFFFAGDHEAAAVIAMIACVTFGVTFTAGKAGQKKSADSLREMDQSM